MVFLAAPYTPPTPANVTVWTSAQHTWRGYDGTEWDLTNGLNGVRLYAGARGLVDQEPSIFWVDAPGVDGSLYDGHRYEKRDVFLPVKVFHQGGTDAWVELNGRFLNTLNPAYTGEWEVTQANGVRRTLRCRFVGFEDDAVDFDPGLVGWHRYGIRMVAEEAYWLGDPETRVFSNANNQRFFGGGTSAGGHGPPFVISPGNTTASASIANLGHVDAYPVWRINGPSTAASVGISGRLITFPFTLASGAWVEINTHPTDQVAWDDNGSDRSMNLGTADFTPIPPGASVPLTVSLTGTGSVEVTLTPRYLRAKG